MTYRNFDELLLSRDRKVSPRGTWQPKYNRWIPQVRNSFGLPSGVTCPGRTDFCESCYAANSENSAGVRDGLEANLKLLTDAGTVGGMYRLLTNLIDRYRLQANRLPEEQRVFRIHWDGDFYSLDYAHAWSLVIEQAVDIQFWAYTRSFVEPVNVVPMLAGIPNLALYLSVDRHNAEAAIAVASEHAVSLALCDTDYHSARQLVPSDSVVRCPENDGRLRLMENGVGACITCGICVTGRRDVMFSTTHREHAEVAPVPVTITTGHAPAGWTQCARAGCPTAWRHVPGRGRPKRYCTRDCQVKALRARVA